MIKILSAGGLRVWCAIGIITLAGCVSTETKRHSGSVNLLEPQAVLKFVDVPVPVGFKICPKESYSFESERVRVGVLRYKGNGDADAVVNFYKEQMPMYNWNLLNTIEYGERLMNFDRDEETCIIRIMSEKGNTVLTISLGPKSPRISPKSSSRSEKLIR